MLTKKTGNYASLLVVTPLVRMTNNQIMEVEAMNLNACNLARKLVCLEDIEECKFDVICVSPESTTDK